MKAILVSAPGGAEQLTLGTHETPEPGPEDVLVRVHATALNRADILQREGKYPPPKGESPLLGLEMAGVVERAPKGGRWKEGDRVCALLGGGGYAEFVKIRQDLLIPVPENLSFEEAAAVPEVFLTAFQALYWLGDLQAGYRVLIHAGASGVGTAAIQLVRAAGAEPMATASAGKTERCRALGATLAVDYKSEVFQDRVLEHTDGHGADLIIDFIGAPYFDGNVKALALDGRIILLATMGGSRVDGFDMRGLFRKRGWFMTSTLRTRALDYKARLIDDFSRRVLPLLEDGKLRPIVDTVYDWKDVAEAHRQMEANENVGKIVLKVG